jgi:hypothetical protein
MSESVHSRPWEPMQAHDGRPLSHPPGASDLRGHEATRGRIRRLADRVGQREHGQEQLKSSRKLSTPRTNKEHIPHLPNFYHHVTTCCPPLYVYIYAT